VRSKGVCNLALGTSISTPLDKKHFKTFMSPDAAAWWTAVFPY